MAHRSPALPWVSASPRWDRDTGPRLGDSGSAVTANSGFLYVSQIVNGEQVPWFCVLIVELQVAFH